MWVCHCLAVREAEILDAVAAGASNVREIARTCGAGSGCGGCRVELRRICAEQLGRLVDRHAAVAS
jgi:bacterioferritin-associated ferredoxin